MPQGRFRLLVLLSAAACACDAAYAVNGIQPGGYGVRNASMGGASIALPLDANAAANNPAGMAFVPTSLALEVQAFSVSSGADFVLPGNHLGNRQTIVAPQGGFNWQFSPRLTIGLSLAGSGAGSDYGQPALPLPGAANAKARLRIAEVIPTVAWKPREDLALGFGLTLAHQQFSADGVPVPAPVPGGVLALPGHGTKSANGVGWRMGVLWKPASDWTLGVNYKARTSMGKLQGYDADLLAYSDGRLDIPAQYGIGIAWRAGGPLTVAVDWLRIQWADLKVMQDPGAFRWTNQSVLRMGASYAISESLTLRGGVSRNSGLFDSARTAQNILVPAINDRAFTFGLSWTLDGQNDLSVGYEFNPTTTLNGTGASSGTNLSSRVQVLMIGWQRRLR